MRRILVAGWRMYMRLYLKRKHVRIGERTFFNKATSFEGRNVINRDCHLYDAYVGLGSYMGSGCVFNKTYIGRYCALGAGIRVSLGDHPIHKIVSIHPAFFSVKKQAGFTFCKKNIWISDRLQECNYACRIGNDVWIGDEVTILGGINIADGTVIGAGAVVTKNTEPYGIYVGVPARKIGSRFTEDEIASLLRIKWWDKNISVIKAKANLFSNIEDFISGFEE